MKPPPHQIYLATRGIPPSLIGMLADALRTHPNCPFGVYHFLAMIALIRCVMTGEPIGVHRTALCDDGAGKREMPDGMCAKMILGRARGGAIMLGAIENGCLGIAEGIETAPSAQLIFNVPVWAVLSASGLANFPVAPGVNFLRIFADHDAAGISAARKCRRRYKKAGIEVEIRYPPTSGDDWNDHVKKEASHGYYSKETDAE